VSGYIEIRCTCVLLDCVILPYKVELQGGQSGNVNDRRMKRDGGTEELSYSVFKDSNMQTNFSSGSNGISVLYLLALFGSYQRTTIYGRLPAGQQRRVGTYTDTPALVVTY